MGVYSAHDRVLANCFSKRNLDGSSTLDYIGCCMDYYAYCIPQHTVLVQLSFTQRNSLPGILISDKDHCEACMHEMSMYVLC